MVRAKRDDLEPFDQFVARESQYPVPWDRSPEESVKADAKRHRNPESSANFTTREETETGRALAAWWVKLLDVWVASDALPVQQREIIRRYFLIEHPCEASGQFVGREYRSVECTSCEEFDQTTKEWRRTTVSVDRSGRITEHNRQYGNEDVAQEMGCSTRWVSEQKRIALETIRATIWPPSSE